MYSIIPGALFRVDSQHQHQRPEGILRIYHIDDMVSVQWNSSLVTVATRAPQGSVT